MSDDEPHELSDGNLKGTFHRVKHHPMLSLDLKGSIQVLQLIFTLHTFYHHVINAHFHRVSNAFFEHLHD